MKFRFVSRGVRRSVAIALGALTLGASLAVVLSSEIGGASSGPAGLTPGATIPHKSTGLTYGSSLGALDETGVPDLVLVIATNGKHGYVYRSALNAADGSNVSTLQGAAAWAAGGATVSHTIAVYAEDGTTVIGAFTILPASPAGAVPPGSPGNPG
jgi:hypothetical protein